MSTSEFFDGIIQAPVACRDITYQIPVFYQDARGLMALFLAPIKKVKALLPSNRLYPLRVTPWHTVISIMAFEYRTCDLGPYNELLISTAVSIDHQSPLFVGLLRPIPVEPNIYVFHLPVTSEFAYTVGAVAGGYPKFIAEIAFKEERDYISCCLSETGQHILTLSIPKGNPKHVRQSRSNLVRARSQRLLRSICIMSEREESNIKIPKNAKLELGSHQISQQLKDLHLGRALFCRYMPNMQLIVSSALESFAI